MTRRSWLTLLSVCTAAAIVVWWFLLRYALAEDGISYLDMARLLARGNFGPLSHPYWSPLYPSLVAVAFWIVSPGPSSELLVAQAVNCAIAFFALASFLFFLISYRKVRSRNAFRTESQAGFRIHTAFAFVLFFWSTLELVGPGVSPDLLAAGLVYAAAGLVCRMALGESRWWLKAVLLGFTLGAGYWTKAAMLPLGLALLVLAAWRLRMWKAVSLAGVVMLLIAAPLVISISRNQRRLTMGESGRLNYSWLVEKQIPLHVGWDGTPESAGTPVRPIGILSRNPTVFTYSGTVPGTFPLWYDPAYFHDGLKVHFSASAQLKAVIASLKYFLSSQGRTLIPLFGGICVLAADAIRRKRYSRDIWLVLWSVAAFAMFALVTIEPRYVGGFAVLFWLSAYDLTAPSPLRLHHRVSISVIGLIVLLFLLFRFMSERTDVPARFDVPTQMRVAQALPALGLHPGSRIATIGYPYKAYFAHLAELQVVANITRDEVDAAEVRRLYEPDASRFEILRTQLRALGVKAIVCPSPCSTARYPGWTPLEGTGYYVQTLN